MDTLQVYARIPLSLQDARKNGSFPFTDGEANERIYGRTNLCLVLFLILVLSLVIVSADTRSLRLLSLNAYVLIMEDLFPSLPDHTRLWVYVAAEPLSDDVQDQLRKQLDAFLAGWTSHQYPVRGQASVQDDRIVMIAATVDGGTVSGCGIDASVNALEEAASDLGISWASPLDIVYRDANGRVCVASRSAFRTLVSNNDITGATPVFDPSITRLEALRAGEFERPAVDSWHSRIFQIPAAA